MSRLTLSSGLTPQAQRIKTTEPMPLSSLRCGILGLAHVPRCNQAGLVISGDWAGRGQ